MYYMGAHLFKWLSGTLIIGNAPISVADDAYFVVRKLHNASAVTLLSTVSHFVHVLFLIKERLGPALSRKVVLNEYTRLSEINIANRSILRHFSLNNVRVFVWMCKGFRRLSLADVWVCVCVCLCTIAHIQSQPRIRCWHFAWSAEATGIVFLYSQNKQSVSNNPQFVIIAFLVSDPETIRSPITPQKHEQTTDNGTADADAASAAFRAADGLATVTGAAVADTDGQRGHQRARTRLPTNAGEWIAIEIYLQIYHQLLTANWE